MRFRFLLLFAALVVLPLSQSVAVVQESPLLVFIRSGAKTHGPGANDHPRFLKEWVPLLNARGARATGADAFPKVHSRNPCLRSTGASSHSRGPP